MGLPRIDLLSGRGLVVVIEHLEFAHADIGRVARARVAEGEAVVAGGRDFKLELDDEIGIFFFI